MTIDCMQQIGLSFDDLKFYAPLVITIFGWIGAIWAWILNDRAKRREAQYLRKEASYRELLLSLKGFYENAKNGKTAREAFLDQLNIAWLYCPDEIIKKGYAFLDTVHTDRTGNLAAEKEKQNALADLVSSIRANLLSEALVQNTTLTKEDFRFLSVNFRPKT